MKAARKNSLRQFSSKRSSKIHSPKNSEMSKILKYYPSQKILNKGQSEIFVHDLKTPKIESYQTITPKLYQKHSGL